MVGAATTRSGLACAWRVAAPRLGVRVEVTEGDLGSTV